MALGDGWTSQLIAGLAQHLEDNSVGVWRSDGTAYTAAEIAITEREIPPEPDSVITIATYPVTSTPGMQDTTVGVQFRVRGTTDPRSCSDIADALFELLDSCGRQTFGDIAIVDITWRSNASLGQDGNLRWEASHNYYVQAMRRTPNRTD